MHFRKLKDFVVDYYNERRVNYIVSTCGLHKIIYLGTNSLKSPSRVLIFHFVTFGGIIFYGINIVSPCGLHKITYLGTNRM
ncbi:hypothetical protein Hanom_Chr00s003348g01712091 [Helianthus anomalus]